MARDIQDSSDIPNLIDGLGLNDEARRMLTDATIDALRQREYRIQGQISHGATAVVHLAKEIKTGRKVAVKVCYRENDAIATALFLREAQILASDDLPRALPLYMGAQLNAMDGPRGRSQPFIIMEYITGEKLHDRLKDPTLDLKARVNIATEIVRVVSLLHSTNLIHGDISPNNVIISPGDDVRVIDLAQGGRALKGYASVDSVSGRAGTRDFSPLALLQGSSKPSIWTDIRQVAAVAFFCVTGHAPGSGTEKAETAKRMEICEHAGIPKPLVRLLLKGLQDRNPRLDERLPDKRCYRCAGDLADALEAWSIEEQWRHRRKRLMYLFGVVAIPLMLFGLYWWGMYVKERDAYDARQVAELKIEVDRLANSSHPAIRNLVSQAADAERRWKTVETHDRQRAELMEQRRLLLRSIEVDRELSWQLPLFDGLLSILSQTPWAWDAPKMSDTLSTLSEEYDSLKALLKSGDTTLAGKQMNEFHAHLAAASQLNQDAVPATEARSIMTVERAAVPERLKVHDGLKDIHDTQERAEKLYIDGDFKSANVMFREVLVKLRDFIKANGTSEEQLKFSQSTTKHIAELQQQLQHVEAKAQKQQEEIRTLNDRLTQIQSSGPKNVHPSEKEQSFTIEGAAGLLDQFPTKPSEASDSTVQAAPRLLDQYTVFGLKKDYDNWRSDRLQAIQKAATSMQVIKELEKVEEIIWSHNEPLVKNKIPSGERPYWADKYELLKTIDSKRRHRSEQNVYADIIPGVNPGDLLVLVIDKQEFRFRWCPPGEFVIGSPADEVGREQNEDQVTIKIENGFWMLETELTKGHWKCITGARLPDWDYSPTENCDPVATINWNQANAVAELFNARLVEQGKLTLEARNGYRWEALLPSEIEWEYSARAGTSTCYSFGGPDKADRLGIYAVWDEQHQGKGRGVSGEKRANAWGLLDMHGGVSELTRSWYEKVINPGDNLDGPASGVKRVVKGGSWRWTRGSLDAQRCAARWELAPDSGMLDLGCRLVLVNRKVAR